VSKKYKQTTRSVKYKKSPRKNNILPHILLNVLIPDGECKGHGLNSSLIQTVANFSTQFSFLLLPGGKTGQEAVRNTRLGSTTNERVCAVFR
jgi:hypothetical protein